MTMHAMNQTTNTNSGPTSPIRERLAGWVWIGLRRHKDTRQQRRQARRVQQLTRHLDDRLIEDVLGSSQTAIPKNEPALFYNALGPSTISQSR